MAQKNYYDYVTYIMFINAFSMTTIINN